MNTKISDAVVGIACEAWLSESGKMRGGDHDCMRVALEAVSKYIAAHAQAHLAADAVPVAHGWLVARPDVSPFFVPGTHPHIIDAFQSELAVQCGTTVTPVYTHPQPAALNEVSGNSGELGGDERARFEAWCKSVGFGAVRHSDGIDAGGYVEEATYGAWCAWQAALAATGKQQVGEVQGDESPMAKMAAALRGKAEAEKAAFDQRVQSGEWGPMPDAGTQADFCQLCDGSGWDGESREKKCQSCSGEGLVARQPGAPNGKLVGWWNGITPGYDGQGDWSIRWGADAEDTRHDIPLYDGFNPIHYQQPAQGIDLSAIATRKLGELAAQGYVTNGVAIFNPSTGQRGLVDSLGFVGWMGGKRDAGAGVDRGD